MNISEKIKALQDNNLSEWLKTRKQVDNEFSERQKMFCVCGRLATGLHESTCKKFNQRVNIETVKRLKHLLLAKPGVQLLTDEQYNSRENQNRDKPIIGFRAV